MITDKTNGRLAEIKAYAKSESLWENFNQTFSGLESYSAKGYEVILYSDLAPLSMEFSINYNGKHVL